jgi:hypothetical protein
MIKICLALLIIISTKTLQGQSIKFDYDEAGNRVQKEVIYLQPRKKVAFQDFIDSTRISLYPNPTTDFLSVEVKNTDALESENFLFKILDQGGKLIKRGTIKNGINQIDFREYPKGIYYLGLIRREDNSSWKIVKQ